MWKPTTVNIDAVDSTRGPSSAERLGCCSSMPGQSPASRDRFHGRGRLRASSTAADLLAAFEGLQAQAFPSFGSETGGSGDCLLPY